MSGHRPSSFCSTFMDFYWIYRFLLFISSGIFPTTVLSILLYPGTSLFWKGQRVCVWLAGLTLPGCLPTKHHRQPWSAVSGDQSAFSRFLGVTFFPLNMVSLGPPMSSASVAHSSRSPTNPACRWAVTYSPAGWGTFELVPVWGCHKKAVMHIHLQSLERLSFLLDKYLWDGHCMWVWVHCFRKFPSSSPEWLCTYTPAKTRALEISSLGLWLVFSCFNCASWRAEGLNSIEVQLMIFFSFMDFGFAFIAKKFLPSPR